MQARGNILSLPPPHHNAAFNVAILPPKHNAPSIIGHLQTEYTDNEHEQPANFNAIHHHQRRG